VARTTFGLLKIGWNAGMLNYTGIKKSFARWHGGANRSPRVVSSADGSNSLVGIRPLTNGNWMETNAPMLRTRFSKTRKSRIFGTIHRNYFLPANHLCDEGVRSKLCRLDGHRHISNNQGSLKFIKSDCAPKILQNKKPDHRQRSGFWGDWRRCRRR
jgi:hypothetical protein